ncbi:hypothetical protein C8R48DRAFT_409867 [Suillus tomentosus]|nr:hypothetical protein C8R48DRAFT_409867 [Suillus tomentosus]
MEKQDWRAPSRRSTLTVLHCCHRICSLVIALRCCLRRTVLFAQHKRKPSSFRIPASHRQALHLVDPPHIKRKSQATRKNEIRRLRMRLVSVNQSAQPPTDYSTMGTDTTYTPSPQNWRSIPIYTVLMDKLADETQLRFGGELKCLISQLDYIQGMGVKAISLSGTIFLNVIWQADSYSRLLRIGSSLGYY